MDTQIISEDEKAFLMLMNRISRTHDWWTSSLKEIPERIMFQRFGMQLRDEDFEQEGISHRGFLIRDRTEAKVAASGFSEFKITDEEFKIKLDVWPFQIAELEVVQVGKLYIKISGVHATKCEDNSECERKFYRHYFLPKGCIKHKRCVYCNSTLTITFEKKRVDAKKPQKVPITVEESSIPIKVRLNEDIRKALQEEKKRLENAPCNDFNFESVIGIDGDSKTVEENVEDASKSAPSDDNNEIPDTSEADVNLTVQVIPIINEDSNTDDKEISTTPEDVVEADENSKGSGPSDGNNDQ